MQQQTHGVVAHEESNRKTDYLYRISVKGLIRNEKGEVLVVKETDRDWWDLPGGGMDHGENLYNAIGRELKEEVNLSGQFTYRVIHVDDPSYLPNHAFWQVRLIFEITPEDMTFSAGDDGDEIAFIHPETFKHSAIKPEQLIYQYSLLN